MVVKCQTLANNTLTGGTITIRSSDNNNDNLVITQDFRQSMIMELSHILPIPFLRVGTLTIRNTTNNNDNVVISENSFVVNDNGMKWLNFEPTRTLSGTIYNKKPTNNNDNGD